MPCRIATDAICSSADETHDAMMTLYASRFGEQVETARVNDILLDEMTAIEPMAHLALTPVE